LKLRRYRKAPDNLYCMVIELREFSVSRKFELRCRVGDLYCGAPLD
jgi:hypothetical protein